MQIVTIRIRHKFSFHDWSLGHNKYTASCK